MNLKNLLKIYSDNNCEIVYIKKLVRNNNSRQQIYLARGNAQILNIFPVTDFKAVLHRNAQKETFHAYCTFLWLDENGKKYLAPNAKFILYPEYPEVRFSGFVQGCHQAPSEILNHTVEGRFLFFGITKTNEILGYVADAETEIANEFSQLKNIPQVGILYSLAIKANKIIVDTKTQLLNKLKEIHDKGWITSKQLKPGNIVAACNESRCGGLTLEAELGIIQNGKSEPDYLGWEVKQFAVKKLHLINSSRITLMTPEPDGGFYFDKGGIAFVKKYGYASSKVERMDFTGQHKFGKPCTKSGLKLEIAGYDSTNYKIIDANGGIFLSDVKGQVAASWSFSKMLTHWNKKHAKAAYVPSLLQTLPHRQYQYSNDILLGIGTEFSFLIKNIALANVFYDPGIHIDNISTKTILKPRSQFRISSRHIRELYSKIELIDLNNIAK